MSSSEPGEAPRLFRFGAFEFDSKMLELTKGEIRIPLQPQPAELLGLLLSRAGDVVDRETIRQALWGDGTTVDFEDGVNRCVRQLRNALLDRDPPRFIRTIPRRGYCFIAEVDFPTAASVRAQVPAPLAFESGEQAADALPSIAVLPFVNMSASLEDEYFSDGLSEEIINGLAQIPGIKVVARTSVFAFKNRNEDVRKVAEALGASNVLEGSVRRSGNRIRVTAQLIHAADGTHLSSKRYDREMTDVFAIQDEISADIAEQLRVRFSPRKRHLADLPAYDAYLEGRFHWNKFTSEGFRKAFECFQRATALDPEYGLAYLGMAYYYLALAIDYHASPLDVLPKAAAAASRAVELGGADAESHVVLGSVAAMLRFDWPAAERHFRLAMESDTRTPARGGYAIWFLAPLGRIQEAMAECDRVIAEDPFFALAHGAKTVASFLARDYDQAVRDASRTLSLDPDSQRGLLVMSWISTIRGHFAEAREYADRLIRTRGRVHLPLMVIGTIHAFEGDREAARRVIEEIQALPGGDAICPSAIASLHAVLGERDQAFEWLERAVDHRDQRAMLVNSLPWFDCLRSDPRYYGLLARMNLAGEPSISERTGQLSLE